MFSSTANIPRLPQDICDSIIDLLYNDRWSLSACSLVCSDWTHRAQYHFFYDIRLRLVHEFHAFHKLLTISAKHLANLPKNLIICFDELFSCGTTADRVHHSTIADRVLPEILPLLPNLRSLSLTITFDYAWWSWEYTTLPLKRAIAQVLQLSTLSHFDMRHWLIGPRCFTALIAHSQALEHLGLYRVYMVDSDSLPDPSDEIKIRCPHDFSLYWHPSDDHISWDISVFNIRSVRTLRLFGSLELAKHIGDSLEVLELQPPDLTRDELYIDLSRSHLLRTLLVDLRYCTIFKNTPVTEGGRDIFQWLCSTLSSISVPNNLENITIIKAISQNSPRVSWTHLDVEGWKSVCTALMDKKFAMLRCVHIKIYYHAANVKGWHDILDHVMNPLQTVTGSVIISVYPSSYTLL